MLPRWCFTLLTNPDTPEMKIPNNMDTFSFPRALLEPLDTLIMENSLPLLSVIEGLQWMLIRYTHL
jgi:hypothetical protein